MTQHAIYADALTYQYGPLTAVNGISFHVGEGEILGFLGPNGAGKSTTVKMLTGQLRPKSGMAKLLGMDVSTMSDKVQAQIGICFEHTNLYESMTAAENLTLFADLFGVKSFDAMALLRRVGLAGRENDRVAGYSKGMKQRLMVARSLVNKPRILFLDEPTDGLDPNQKHEVRSLINAMSKDKIIVISTHILEEVDAVCSRAIIIAQGRIVADDTPQALEQQSSTGKLEDYFRSVTLSEVAA